MESGTMNIYYVKEMFSLIRLLVSIFTPIMNCNMKRLMITWVRNERKHTFKSIKELNERGEKRYSLIKNMRECQKNCYCCQLNFKCNSIIGNMETYLRKSEWVL